jgi:hypothetical protein
MALASGEDEGALDPSFLEFGDLSFSHALHTPLKKN